MTLTLELTPEQEAALQAQATAAGIDATEYAQRLLASDLVTERRPMTGAEALAFWEREGLRGVFADRPDSQTFARQLREAEEAREEEEASWLSGPSIRTATDPIPRGNALSPLMKTTEEI